MSPSKLHFLVNKPPSSKTCLLRNPLPGCQLSISSNHVNCSDQRLCLFLYLDLKLFYSLRLSLNTDLTCRQCLQSYDHMALYKFDYYYYYYYYYRSRPRTQWSQLQSITIQFQLQQQTNFQQHEIQCKIVSCMFKTKVLFCPY